jgi:phosphoglycolate phosphatase-like HAD superfamily hydrolase
VAVHERIVGLLAPEGAWMIGDRDTDVECAMAGDVRPILVHTPARNARQAIFVKDSAGALRHIGREQGPRSMSASRRLTSRRLSR